MEYKSDSASTPANKGTGNEKQFYFLPKHKSLAGSKSTNVDPLTTAAVAPTESIPSRPVRTNSQMEATGESQPWWKQLFRLPSQVSNYAKMRKVPVKVEPKVFFANERTFLAWLNMAVTLASISIAIMAFAENNAWSTIYGIFLMPVAIAFCVYALIIYLRRASMIRQREPGPYEDKVGPIVLTTMLILAITVNFAIKLVDVSA